MKLTIPSIFGLVATGAVTLAIVYGLVLVGSPEQQRKEKIDAQRVLDLQSIMYGVDAYWQRNQVLPSSLEDLKETSYVYVDSIADPVTREPYEYRSVTGMSFELCAIFDIASSDRSKIAVPIRYPDPTSWNHGIGRACFTREVTKPAAIE